MNGGWVGSKSGSGSTTAASAGGNGAGSGRRGGGTGVGAAGAGAYAEGPAVILDTQKRVTAERSFLDELDRRLRDD